MNNSPLVSVICLAYNHEPYIRQCLDGFVMQKTNFRFEALVHDDASTDGTADIIREYAAKYPDIIKPIYQTENQYQKKVGILKTFLFPRATGKYIAMCEGDDYWTDPLKLQKQVDFLEKHLGFSMCCHCCKSEMMTHHDKENIVYPSNITKNLEFELADYVEYKWVPRTLSVLFRAKTFQDTLIKQYSNSTDISIFFELLKCGKGLLFHEVMGVYRVHSAGVWSGISVVSQVVMSLKAINEICRVNKSRISTVFLKNYMNSRGYLGLSFFAKHSGLWIDSIMYIFKFLGFKEAIKLCFRSCNFFQLFKSN